MVESNSLLDSLTAQLESARQSHDLDDLAAALVRHANALVELGQLASAQVELDEAAAIHQQQGRPYDEARCTHFAATLCRLTGDLEGAKQRLDRASPLAEPGTPVAVSIATEQGELALAEGQASVAAAAYRRALDEGKVAGLLDTAQAALLRKRAIALTFDQRYQEAAQDLSLAYALLQQAGDRTTAIRTLIEAATALHQGGEINAADTARQRAREAATEATDHHALSDLYLLDAAAALNRQDGNAALEAALLARTHALEAIAPISYISAALAIAQLSEALGDRAAAYEALAVGWVTLADLLGRDTAKATFAPKLEEMRDRWGEATFTQVKTEYENQRRAKSNTNSI